MTAHVLFPAIDPKYPATLSEKILKGILRDRFGFQGLVISDGIAMPIFYSFKNYVFTLSRFTRSIGACGTTLIRLSHSQSLPDGGWYSYTSSSKDINAVPLQLSPKIVSLRIQTDFHLS